MSASSLHVPLPYPDELLYSLGGRFGRDLGISSPKKVLSLLYGHRFVVVCADLPGYFGRLRWIVTDRWGMLLEDGVWAFTLLPYYVASRPLKERSAMVEALIRDRATGLHTGLGICTSNIHHHNFLTLCPECAKEDIGRLGEPYWHRAHQLPGVFVCHAHGAPLVSTSVPIRPRGRHEYIAAAPKHLIRAETLVDVSEEERVLAQEIAVRSNALLTIGREAEPVATWADIQAKLRAAGHGRGRGCTSRLRAEFAGFYGERLLSFMAGDGHNEFSMAWLDASLRKPKHHIHPLRMILLDMFLDRHVGTGVDKPFEEGPWPCLNWHAKHYRQSVVTRMARVATKDMKAIDVARFTCDCGFVYTREAGADPMTYSRIVRFGPLFISQARELRAAGYTINSIARTLGVDWITAQRFLGEITGKCANASIEGLSQDQEAWLRCVAGSPGVGVKEIRRQNKALFMRLYRRCPEWLKAHSPRAARRENQYSRVNWSARDADLASRVEHEAEKLRSIKPPVRVTINRIAGILGCRSLLQQKLDKLPKTHEALVRLCESPFDFRVRRLQVARADHPGAPRWRLLRAAALREEYATQELITKAGLMLKPSAASEPESPHGG